VEPVRPARRPRLPPLLHRRGALDGGERPAHRGARLVPARPPRVGDEQLTAASGLVEVVWQAGSLVGAALGGPILVRFGLGTAFAVDAATYAPSALALLALDHGPAAAGGPHESGLAMAREGFAYLRPSRASARGDRAAGRGRADRPAGAGEAGRVDLTGLSGPRPGAATPEAALPAARVARAGAHGRPCRASRTSRGDTPASDPTAPRTRRRSPGRRRPRAPAVC